jgi:hypothetical protein
MFCRVFLLLEVGPRGPWRHTEERLVSARGDGSARRRPDPGFEAVYAHSASCSGARNRPSVKQARATGARSSNDGTRQGRDWGGDLLRISREFAKSIEWLLTGEG